jgi:hypothetical protein
MPKIDCLKECNDQGVPLEDFRLAFCARCYQEECTRSQQGKSLFEARVSTWEDRLFNNVPRMDPNDPRYAILNAKRFLTIDVGRTPELQSWIDPLEVKEPEPVLVVPAEPKPELKALEPEVNAPDLAPVVISEKIASPKIPNQVQTLMNTAVPSGQMIGKKQQNASAPVYRDPWASSSTTPSADTTKVVPRGAKIRLGS